MAYVILVFTALLSGGCRKELCYEYHPAGYKVFVMVHDDNIDVPMGKMRIDFFPEGTDKVLTRFVDIGGGYVELPRGRYSSVVFNDDSDYVSYDGTGSVQSYKACLPFITRSQYNMLYGGQFVPYSDSPAAISTTAPAVRGAITKGDGDGVSVPCIGQPDPLFADTNRDFQVTGDEATQQELHFTPQNMVVVYHIRVDVTGMRNVIMSRGRIKTGANAKFLYSKDREFVDDVGIMFDCGCSDTDVSTVVTSFGLILGRRGTGSADVVTFEVLLKDGSSVSFDFDITDRLSEELCVSGGTIDLSGLHITIDDVDEKGGFDPKLEDWGDEENIQL